MGVAQPAVLAASPNDSEVVRLRRLNEQEYRDSIADIFGSNIIVQGIFEPGARMGGLMQTSSSVLSITPSGFDYFSQMAKSIATQVVSKTNRARLAPCAPRSPAAPDNACASQFFAHYGLLLFRRPLTSDELKMRVDLAGKLTASSHDFYAGLGYSLSTLLDAPEFLFRSEVAVPAGSPANGKDYTLDGYSRAARLSYLFWNTTPDAELLQVAASGELNTQAGVARQVDRIMASPRLETGMRAFFSDMLQLGTLDTTTKDTAYYPKWNSAVADSAREETLRVAIDLGLKSNDDIRNLMTTQKSFVNRVIASLYGVPFNFNGDWEPVTFPASAGRSGLLTQVSMLSMFSHPGRSSPTERGVALMDIFLCAPTPLPPANVDFSIVNNVGGPLKTVRQRLMAHATNPGCASCHTHSDPIGLTLEGFDSIGQPRSRDFANGNGEAIDVSGTLQGKPFEGAQGLGKVLHDDPKFAACVARKLYAYGTGENAYDDVDPGAYQAAYKEFVSGGYRLKTLLKAMVTAPDFFNAPAPVAAPAETKSAMNLVK